MKNKKLILFLIFIFLFSLVSCNTNKYELAYEKEIDEIYVGDDVDFTTLIYVVDGKLVRLTKDQIDTSKVDLTKEGTYEVTISYKDFKETVKVKVNALKLSIDCQDVIKVNQEEMVKIVTEPEREITSIHLMSSDEEVIKVDGNKIIALKEGKATITAEYHGLNASKEITVVEEDTIYVSDLKVSLPQEMNVGSEDTFEVKVMPENATNKAYTVSVSDESLLNISGNTMNALKEGNVIVTIKSNDGKVTKEFIIEVIEEKGVNESLDKIYEIFNDVNNYNFKVEYELSIPDFSYSYKEEYEYNKDIISYTYELTEGFAKDYVIFNDDYSISYYAQLDDGYTLISEDDEYFEFYYSYLSLIDFSKLSDYEIIYNSGKFLFTNPKKASDELFGTYEDEYQVLEFSFTTKDDLIDTMTITTKVYDSDDAKWYTYNERITFSNYGKVTLSLEDVMKIVEGNEDLTLVTSASTNIPNVLNVGKELELEITLLPESALDKNYTLTISDESIVKLENNLLIALKEGKVTLTLTSSDGNYTCDYVITIVEESTENPALDLAFSKFNDVSKYNFSVLFMQSYLEIDDIYIENYEYYNNIIKYSYEYLGYLYNDYICYKDKIYYLSEEDNTYTCYEENDEYFDLYYYYATLLNLDKLSELEYVYTDGVFYAKDAKKAKDLILGEFEGTYNVLEFSFTLKNGLIDVITIKTKVLDDEENKWYTLTETFTISNYDKVYIDEKLIDSYIDNNQENEIASNATFIFVDKEFNTENDDAIFVSSKTPYGFDNNRGVQFTQNVGIVEIISNQLFENIKSITLTVATNQQNGMTVAVKVGDTYLKYGSEEYAFIEKTNFNENVTVSFSAAETLSGVLTIILTPASDSKSMYISKVSINDSESSLEVMEKQEYDESTFSDQRIQSAIEEYGESIGLPSIGTYNVLVIPVQFPGEDSFTQDELNKLEKAFNGTSIDTGWESVKSFYYKSSYGKLDLTFDIYEPFTASQKSSYYVDYYNSYYDDYGYSYYEDGSTLLLLEALAYYDSLIDYSNYDYNNDNVIDGIYLIYNHDIAYNSENELFWAYVTTYVASEEKNQTYDDIDAYYYLFAGIDFIIEDVEGGYEYNGTIDGLLINSETYIHESGHMLMLDDYYDYDEDSGANTGVGGADMMDYTNGDHCSYSKIMLGWITPQIVNETKKVTVNSFESSGDAIMILLDSNNSYFCEYLLIDLYTNDGLNELRSNTGNLFLDCEYGIRIYHVISFIDNPYSDEYYSFTDYNNSYSDYSLLTLIEHDGEKHFETTSGIASQYDLFYANDKLSDIDFTTKDGKALCFDVEILSLNSECAEIQITFIETGENN